MIAVKEKNSVSTVRTARSYGLDIIKLFLTAMVFLSHTMDFRPETITLTSFIRRENTGWFSVHYFFVISGFLMVNSFLRKNKENSPENSGKKAIGYVWGRFKGIAPMYYTAFFMSVVFYFGSDITRLAPKVLVNVIYKLIPESFMLNMAGFDDALYLNLPTWYIQAMLICMIPAYYLLSRNRDLFLNVIAPLGALGALVFLYSNPRGTDFVIKNQLIRGFCGILSGCAGYKIYEKIRDAEISKKEAYLFTALEIFIYIFCFVGSYTAYISEKNNILSVIPFPVAAAITFSGKSLTGKIFSSPKLKFIGTLSTVIYFNHWLARRIVLTYFSDAGWRRATFYMALFTIATCVIYYGLRKLFSLIWRKISAKKLS